MILLILCKSPIQTDAPRWEWGLHAKVRAASRPVKAPQETPSPVCAPFTASLTGRQKAGVPQRHLGKAFTFQVKAPSHLWYFWGLNGLQELWSPIPSSLPTSLLSALKTRTHQSMGFVATGKETPLPRRWTCSFDRCPSPRPSPKALMENCVSPEAAAGATGQQREAVGPNMQQARRPKS